MYPLLLPVCRPVALPFATRVVQGPRRIPVSIDSMFRRIGTGETVREHSARTDARREPARRRIPALMPIRESTNYGQ